MPRTAREVIDGGIYHVLTRGNNGQPVFHHDADYERYLQLLARYAHDQQVKVYHFALLPTSVHLVLEIALSKSLSKLMQGINLSYALSYRTRYGYHGHLWQGRFESLLIDRDTQGLECGRYVELQPVRAGLVQEPSAYAWTSYRAYAEGAEVSFLALNPRYELLGPTVGERHARYRQLARAALLEGRSSPLHARPRLMAVSPGALQNAEPLFSVSGIRRAEGRPKKPLFAGAVINNAVSSNGSETHRPDSAAD